MDDVQQLGEMLHHYADSEAHKKQQLDLQAARWAQKLGELFQQIEQWLEPVKSVGLLEVQREAYTASGPSVPAESSPFKGETTLGTEAQFLDGASNKVVAQVERKGTGKPLANESQVMKADDVKGVIDGWAADLHQSYMKLKRH